MVVDTAHTQLVDVLQEQGHKDLKVLDIGGAAAPTPTVRYSHWSSISNDFRTLDIDPTYNPNYVMDIERETGLATGEFDIVLCGQMLEHTFNFINVINETKRLASGMCVFDVPFVYPYHEAPNDFWRFSPAAMARLCLAAGFKTFSAWFLASQTVTWCLAVNDPARFDLEAIITILRGDETVEV